MAWSGANTAEKYAMKFLRHGASPTKLLTSMTLVGTRDLGASLNNHIFN
jgi:hypothetical protein